MTRRYELINNEYRDMVNLKNYEDIIKRCIKEVRADIDKITVEEKYFEYEADAISIGNIGQINSKIAKSSDIFNAAKVKNRLFRYVDPEFNNLSIPITEKEIKQVSLSKINFTIIALQYSSLFITLIAVLLLLLSFSSTLKSVIMLNTKTWFIISTALGIITINIFLYKQYVISKNVNTLKVNKHFDELDEELSDFEQLSKINIRHLNSYYKQIYDQCDQSFFLAKLSSNIGYGLMVLGLGLYLVTQLFQISNISENLILFASTGSGIVVKIISSIYFYLYNKSVWNLNSYHDKLFRIQNVLITLSLSNSIEDKGKKDDARTEIIKRLIDDSFNPSYSKAK